MRGATRTPAARGTLKPSHGARRRTSDNPAGGPAHGAHRSRRRARQRSGLVTIVLAEELQLVRRGVRCLLETERDFRIVGETDDGLAVVSLVQRVQPRVLVTAVAMPGLNGLEVARQVRERIPTTAVVVLSMYGRTHYVAQALKHGASAYVLKRASPSELVRAIRRAVAGHRYLSQPFSERSIRTWLARAKTEAFDAYDTLTDRERQILQLVAEGYTSPAIAARLRISVRTVEAHRASIMRKMDFRNLADVILFAINRGIIVRARTEPTSS
jgi:two-component system, NarL family, response regulator NreC